MDATIEIDTNLDLESAVSSALSTFMCSANIGRSCVVCHSSCIHCVTSRVEDCVSASQADFAYYASDLYNLPLTDETDGMICYRQPVPQLDCNPLAIVTGTISEDVDGLHPTKDQCNELLTIQWPVLTGWFNEFFPDFTLPAKTGAETSAYMNTELKVWILQYGPSAMSADPLWQALINTFNSATLDWTKLLAWGGATPGYSPDGSTTARFPAALEASVSGGKVQLDLFNYFSTVCNSACSFTTECQMVKPDSVCTQAS